jgi:hypothetical protein
MSATKIETNSPNSDLPEWLELVRRQVESLRYGTVQIVVHDSQVTQIEKVERVRLDKPAPETNGPNTKIRTNNRADRITGSS